MHGVQFGFRYMDTHIIGGERTPGSERCGRNATAIYGEHIEKDK